LTRFTVDILTVWLIGNFWHYTICCFIGVNHPVWDFVNDCFVYTNLSFTKPGNYISHRVPAGENEKPTHSWIKFRKFIDHGSNLRYIDINCKAKES